MHEHEDPAQPCFFAIPFHGRYIIYRPLRHAAFVGNKSMADLARKLVSHPGARVNDPEREAASFLREIGFLDPDPPAPAQPDARFLPGTAVLLLTNDCNLRCTYCYADAGERPREEMPAALATGAVDVAAENARELGQGAFALVFHGGGEPVVHWDVFRAAVERAREKDIDCNISMSSNGFWSAGQRDFILDNLNGISLSFDGTPEVQNAQRPAPGGAPSFDRVLESIRAMDERRFPYNIRLTISTPYLEKLPECVGFIFRETACRSVQVEPAFGAGRVGWRNPSVGAADRFIAAYIEAMDVAEEHRGDLMYSGARPWMTACDFCTAADTALVVRPDGKLVACYEVTDSRHELADVFTVGRLDGNGPTVDRRALDILRKLRRERFELCRDCFCVWHCAGDCSSRAFAPGEGGHLRFNNRCRINRELTKEYLARYIERSGGVWISEVSVRSGAAGESEDTCGDCRETACERKNTSSNGRRKDRL